MLWDLPWVGQQSNPELEPSSHSHSHVANLEQSGGLIRWLWEEPEEPKAKPRRHEKSMKTPHRQVRTQNLLAVRWRCLPLHYPCHPSLSSIAFTFFCVYALMWWSNVIKCICPGSVTLYLRLHALSSPYFLPSSQSEDKHTSQCHRNLYFIVITDQV